MGFRVVLDYCRATDCMTFVTAHAPDKFDDVITRNVSDVNVIDSHDDVIGLQQVPRGPIYKTITMTTTTTILLCGGSHGI